MKEKLILFIILLILGIGGYLFTAKFSVKENKNTVENKMPAGQLTDVKETEVVKEFTMTAKQWSFDPEEIRVKQGDKVRLKISSIDVDHGFGLPDFDVSVKLLPGKEEIVEFIADKKGEFTFFCDVLCGQGHRDMKGLLVVE